VDLQCFPYPGFILHAAHFFLTSTKHSNGGIDVPETALFVRECYLQIHTLQTNSQPDDEDLTRISNMFRLHMFKQTSDPRDKIYGLIGLVSSWRHTFPIDYKVSASEVYIVLFKFITKKYYRLDTLVNHIRIESSNPAGLPSWCPDWSQTKLPDYVVSDTEVIPNLFDTPMQLEYGWPNGSPVYSLSGNDRILIARGVVLDVCEGVIACFNGTHSFRSSTQKEILDDAQRLARNASVSPYWSPLQGVEPSHPAYDHQQDLESLHGEKGKVDSILSV
jgi:hypothetical protein